MDFMFASASSFNQDLRVWCVSKITSTPQQFATSSGTPPSLFPVWGTCPPLPPTPPPTGTPPGQDDADSPAPSPPSHSPPPPSEDDGGRRGIALIAGAVAGTIGGLTILVIV
eukprot:scaffold3184_cov636-Pavlova_lutheri.AAC.1